MLNIKNEIKSAFLENKTAVYISIILLLGTLIAGYVLQPYLQSIFDPVVDKLTEDVKNGVITLTFQTIFTNNILIVFRMFVLGIFFCFSGVILAYNPTILLKLFMKLMRLMHWISQVMLEFLMVLTRNFFWLL